MTGGREINIYFTIYSVLNMVTRYIKRRNSLRLILKKRYTHIFIAILTKVTPKVESKTMKCFSD